VQGFFGRESKQVRLEVCLNTKITTIQPLVEAKTVVGCRLCTDESKAYSRVSASGREHLTVCHSAREFAIDLDQDGFCEVHCNSDEGLWTGLRNFIRRFRGVHKRYLAQYVAVFELAHNHKSVSGQLLRTLIVPDYYLDQYDTS
jgi:transposase